MYLPADTVAIGTSCRKEHPQRLLSSIAGALGHDIVEGTGWLRVELIENAGTDIQTVLGGNLAGQHLINAAGGFIHHALDGWNDLDALVERRILTNHVDSNIKHDCCLLPVGSTGVNLRLPLTIVDQHIQGQSGTQFGLALLLWDLNIGCSVLAFGRIVIVRGTKNIPDNLLLPREQSKRLPVEFALRVLQALDKANNTFSLVLIISHRRYPHCPASRASIGSSAAGSLPPAIMRERVAGVKPNSEQKLCMIRRFCWAIDT